MTWENACYLHLIINMIMSIPATYNTNLLDETRIHISRAVDIRGNNSLGGQSWFVVRAIWHFLTNWGRVTHIGVCKITTVGSDNGLSPGRGQAVIWTIAGVLLNRSKLQWNLKPNSIIFIQCVISFRTCDRYSTIYVKQIIRQIKFRVIRIEGCCWS